MGVQALVCMEQLVAGQPKHQEALMMAKVADSQGGDIPALQAILRVSPSLAGSSWEIAAGHVKEWQYIIMLWCTTGSGSKP